MNEFYKEEILEHYRNPQNFGKLSNFSHSSKIVNPFCGDKIEMYIYLQDGVISAISFVAEGCAISIAAASLLTEYVEKKHLKELTVFSENTMLDLLNIEISETRKKCALLAYSAFKDALWGNIK
ncbi:MAG: iron-sulfur cluster scaffold-like protein [Patescibacteria group bacterium]|nr:MAG: iron-sulfur cluster scaffold-like protein [Patescibacteria group bacterium]